VCHLVASVFMEHIAPLYEPEGITEFLQYASVHETTRRLHHDHVMLLAEHHDRIVGVIELRDYNHISLLFVDTAYQRQGIAHELVKQGLALCLQQRPDLNALTVSASPNAAPAYERFGFRVTQPEQTRNGIRYVPMAMDVPAQHEPQDKHHHQHKGKQHDT
jgi:predicted GNAT family N-acyltransferase